MRRARRIFLVVVVTGLTLLSLRPHISAWIAGTHQRSVTRTLAAWERDVPKVTNWTEARHAVDLMDYVKNYYVPAEGYRSNVEIEGTLAVQRQKTLEAIARGMQTYSGENFGTDVEKWKRWEE